MIASEQAELTAWSTMHGNVVPWPRRWHAIFTRPLPHLKHEPITRWLCRLIVAIWGKRVEKISGLERLPSDRSPFILCLNHSSRTEALVLPALLMFHGGGRPIHFLADWNFMLFPGLGFLMRRAKVIPVGRKPARPRWLNVLKPLYVPPGSSLQRAKKVLAEGGIVAVFPEGTVNRNPTQLLPGCLGAARLAQETGLPVIPAGVRHPLHDGERLINGRDKMHLIIGEPLPPINNPSRQALQEHHARIMTAISQLCGKPWHSLN